MSEIKNYGLSIFKNDNLKWIEFMRKTRKHGFNISINQTGYRVLMICKDERVFVGKHKTDLNEAINDCKKKFGWDDLERTVAGI